MRCSPDGRYLASAGDDGLVLLWSLATGLRIKTFHGHTAPINSLAFSNESTVLVSGAADDTVRVWDVATPPGEGANPSDVPSAQGAGGTSAAAPPTGVKARGAGGVDAKRRASAAAAAAGGGLGAGLGIAGKAGADGKEGKGKGARAEGLGLVPRATAGDGPWCVSASLSLSLSLTVFAGRSD